MLQRKTPIFEVCANGLQSAINAQVAGADRIELCENLEVDGVTPRISVIERVQKKVTLPIHILIRPRAGDFCYSNQEFLEMMDTVETCKKMNVAGIVIGILDHDFHIDKRRCAELIELAHPLSTTFHRAFDVVRDPFQSLDELIALRFDRVLTSGQQKNALEGAGLINQLVKHASGKICILAGGGINEENITPIAQQSGANEFHFSAKTKLADGNYVSDPVSIRKICDLAKAAL